MLLARLAEQVAAVAGRPDDADPGLPRQAEILQALDELEAQVAQLTRHLAQLPDAIGASDECAERLPAGPGSRRGGSSPGRSGRRRSGGCAPGSSRSTGPATDGWRRCSRRAGNSTRSASTPWTGSASCGPCCTSARTGTAASLAAQGEWQTRLLIAAAEQMASGTAGCQHSAHGAGRFPAGPAHGPVRGRPTCPDDRVTGRRRQSVDRPRRRNGAAGTTKRTSSTPRRWTARRTFRPTGECDRI